MDKRMMRDTPHKRQEFDQSMTKHPTIQGDLHKKFSPLKAIYQFRIKLLSLPSSPFLIANQMSSELNNIEKSAFKCNNTRGPKGGMEVK